MNSFSRAFHYLLQRKKYYFFGLIALFAVDFSQLYIPVIMQKSIDLIAGDNFKQQTLLNYALMISLLGFVVLLSRFIWRYLIIGTALYIETNLRNDYFSHLLKLHKSYFSENKTGDFVSQAVTDITSIRMVFGIGFVACFDGIVMTIISLSFMSYINLKLTMYVSIPFIVISVLVFFFGRLVHSRFTAVQESYSDISSKAIESISGIKVIKGYLAEKYTVEKFEELSRNSYVKNMDLIKVWGVFHPMLAAIVGFSAALLIFTGGKESIAGNFTAGEFAAFIAYLGILTWPMMAIGWVMNIYERGRASMDRINSVMDVEPLIKNDPDAQDISDEYINITFESASFRHENSDNLVLNNINLQIRQGEKIAVVGKTGSGKTTLINMLIRLYDPVAGGVLVNNVDIRKIKLESLRNHIVLIPQESFIFSESITDNIIFGTSDDAGTNLEAIHSASRSADFYDTVQEFPGGFGTVIGERGINLSGGQKQRLTIARALLNKSNVLILDDCLSAVDTGTEKRIIANIVDLYKDKTLIIISHRIASIIHSDRIIVIDDGCIVETGTHEELSSMKGVYYDLYKKQIIEENLNNVSL